ncbi:MULTISPECIES: pyruvate ferredoxin oxidoreductase [Campylobacter]|uniref:Pyruvate ferredoxin oxidoreductase n=1 Tax=Campylobacter taeniopygiae TaxID=2510188 RepID=A0ABY2TMQ6_9BACT|nr:pyruvate ferredoxin oxidoreductase [Campylobacter sp. B0100352/1]MBZ7964765.1 pyruvate ferredoxin oxidoreductase [Campylobacter sp. 2457A]TKX34388.1 pyruvate ferredoxin oxidoreductase [Campylobacter taeniopygiae]
MKIILFFISMMLCLNVCNATPLDEIFKDIEVSGTIRYTCGNSKSKNIHGYNFNRNDINISKIN